MSILNQQADTSLQNSTKSRTNKQKFQTLLKWDFVLQKSYKITPIYGLVTLIYIILLYSIPITDKRPLLVFLLLTDPAMLGFLFIAALIYFEKTERVLEAISVSPIPFSHYLWSKVLSLTFISMYTCAFITLIVYGIDLNWIAFLSGIVLTSIFFVLIGFAMATYFRSFNEFMFSALGITVFAMLPMLNYMGITETWIFYPIPLQSAIWLLDGAFHEIAPINLFANITYLCVCIFGAYKWTVYAFDKNIIKGAGMQNV
jgi:fluoroquinolone transport system permease protein